jgi:hypothetical protein
VAIEMATEIWLPFFNNPKKLKFFFALTTELIKLLDYDWGLDRSTEKAWPTDMATEIYSPFFNRPKKI